MALSFTVSVPVAVPVSVGENATLMVQLFLLSSVVPQVVVETENGPVVEWDMPVSVVFRLFFNVNLYAALVSPTFVSLKMWLLGVSVACASPAPERETVCGLPEALSAKLSVPVSEPGSVGVKVTLTLHFLPAPSVLPQVLAEIAKLVPTLMLPMSSVTEPLFFTVTDLAALVVSIAWLPKLREVGDSVTVTVPAAASLNTVPQP